MPKLPNAILVAGGGGTLSETVTGLFRREDGNTCTIGILPVGRTNAIGWHLFSAVAGANPDDNVDSVKSLVNASMSAVRGRIAKKDAIKIELITDGSDTEAPIRPIYALGSLQWGAFRDILSKRDKYWYTNGLREYFAFMFNAFSDDVTWNCRARLVYTDPCRGCKMCRMKVLDKKPAQNTRWWSKFVPRSKPTAPEGIDYSKITNEACNRTHEIEIDSTEFELVARTLVPEQTDIPRLKLKLSGALQNGFSYTLNAWNRIKSNTRQLEAIERVIEAKSVEIIPEIIEGKEKFYSIDNEDFEVKPIRVSVVPEALRMFVL